MPALYDFERYWVSVDQSLSTGDQGFSYHLIDNFSTKTTYTLAELEDEKFLLLRGSSSSGKSSALAQEFERLIQFGSQAVWIDLAEHVDFKLELASLSREAPLSLFFDGFDIACVQRVSLHRELDNYLSSLAHAGWDTRVRIAIRSGFLVPDFIAADARMSEYTIAPLSAKDVFRAAEAEGLDGDRFRRELKAFIAGPLATHPPTLIMLLKMAKSGKAFDLGRDKLYERGCEKLILEENSFRLNQSGGDDDRFVGKLDKNQRVAVARRIAGLMEFGGYEALNLGPDGGNNDELFADNIAGGSEPTPRSSVEVTRSSVREVVRTALFRPLGNDRYCFAHESFKHYLAAKFLCENEFSLPQVRSLIEARSESGERCIAQNRIGVASWLAALETVVMDRLVEFDPMVCLYAGIPASQNATRLKIAKSLLKHSGTVNLEYLRRSGDAVLVSNSDMAKLLEPVLIDTKTSVVEKELALLLARHCEVNELAPLLVKMMSDENVNHDLRLSAGNALFGLDYGSETAALISLAREGAIKDEDEALRGCALKLLFPKYLTAAEAIRLLPPFEPHDHIGKYCRFVTRHINAYITPESLPAALEEASRLSQRFPEGRHFGSILTMLSGLGVRAFRSLQDQRVADAFASMILDLRNDIHWEGWTDTFLTRGLPNVTTTLRRDLIMRISEKVNDPLDAKRLLEISFLVQVGDLKWLLEQAASFSAGPTRSFYSTLAVEVARDAPLNSIAKVTDRLDAASKDAVPMPLGFKRDKQKKVSDLLPRYAVVDPKTEEASESIMLGLGDMQLRSFRMSLGGKTAIPGIRPLVLLDMSQDMRSRLVKDDFDLARVVKESLTRLQSRLKGKNAIARALWDMKAGGDNTPKNEYFLCDFITDHLREDLTGRGVLADREVEIKPSYDGSKGARTDINVQAVRHLGRSKAVAFASTTIEVKLCKNTSLYTAMRSQLRDDYMALTKEKAGIFLVGWYVCPSWKKPVVDGVRETRLDALQVVTETLAGQAKQLSGPDCEISLFMLDATI